MSRSHSHSTGPAEELQWACLCGFINSTDDDQCVMCLAHRRRTRSSTRQQQSAAKSKKRTMAQLNGQESKTDGGSDQPSQPPSAPTNATSSDSVPSSTVQASTEAAGSVLKKLRDNSYIYRIVDDVWVLIIRFLDVRSHFLLARTCKHIHSLCARPSSWGSVLRLSPFRSHFSDAVLPQLVSSRRISTVNLAGCDQLTNTGLAHIAMSPIAHSLRSINLSGCWRITNDGLKALSSVKGLRRLVLAWLWKINDEGVRHLAVHLPRLDVLDVTGCWYVSEPLIALCASGKARLPAKPSAGAVDAKEAEALRPIRVIRRDDEEEDEKYRPQQGDPEDYLFADVRSFELDWNSDTEDTEDSRQPAAPAAPARPDLVVIDSSDSEADSDYVDDDDDDDDDDEPESDGSGPDQDDGPAYFEAEQEEEESEDSTDDEESGSEEGGASVDQSGSEVDSDEDEDWVPDD